MSKDPSGDSSLQLLFVFGSEERVLLLSKISYKWDSGNFRERLFLLIAHKKLCLCMRCISTGAEEEGAGF